MFRQSVSLNTLFMSLTFRISGKQMHLTCNCKSVHCIYAKIVACTVYKNVFYVCNLHIGVYHKHTICFIGHVA